MNKIRVPFFLTLSIYLGLAISISLFLGLYFCLYYYYGEAGVIVGLVPLLCAFVSERTQSGLVLGKKKHLKLRQIVNKISDQLDITPPDEIAITPLSEIYVSGVLRKRLTIGIASFRNLSIGEFKAIVAHEMGHFYGKDTFIGVAFWNVNHALTMVKKSPYLRVLGLFGGLILFFCIIYQYLLNIIHFFYSRQMEHRADFLAMKIAGETDFQNGLINHSTFSIFFNSVGINSIVNLLNQQRAYVNIYGVVYDVYTQENIVELKTQVIESDRWNPFSTHPTLRSRLNNYTPSFQPIPKAPASELFDNFEDLEKDMTKAITIDLHNRIHLNKLYQDAVAREGRCQYCKNQFQDLKELLDHEAGCKSKP